MKIKHKLPSSKSVLIATPNQGEMKTETTTSIWGLIKPIRTEGAFTQNTLLYASRNSLCRRAVEEGFTHILFIDSDMVFPADALVKLLALEADVATAIYYSRYAPYNPQIYTHITPRIKGCESGIVAVDERVDEKQPFTTVGCGMGFCLIDCKVIKWLYSQDKEPFDLIDGLGEDLSFCYKIRDKFTVQVEPSIEMGHIGRYTFTKKDYLRLKENGIHG